MLVLVCFVAVLGIVCAVCVHGAQCGLKMKWTNRESIYVIYNFSSLHFPFYFLALSNRFLCCVFMIKASNKKSFEKKSKSKFDIKMKVNFPDIVIWLVKLMSKRFTCIRIGIVSNRCLFGMCACL